MSTQIYDALRVKGSSTPAPVDMDGQTIASLSVSLDPSRPSSSVSPDPSRRPSSNTLISRKRTNSRTFDLYDDFILDLEDSPPYLSTPKRVNESKTFSLLDKIDPKPTIQLVVLSASGQKVALLSQYSFWIFETRFGTLISSRVSPKERRRRSVFERRQRDTELPDEPFQCAALSDRYLAIGLHDVMVIFSAVEGHTTERPVFRHSSESTKTERLKFASKGEQLAVVLRDTGQDRTQVLIFSTATFSEEQCKEKLDSEPSKISWNDSPYNPNDMAFSPNGKMLVICSSPSGSRAEFRILRKFGEDWAELLVQEVELFGGKDKVGLGFSRVTLYDLHLPLDR